jgi:hypothetical protein
LIAIVVIVAWACGLGGYVVALRLMWHQRWLSPGSGDFIGVAVFSGVSVLVSSAVILPLLFAMRRRIEPPSFLWCAIAGGLVSLGPWLLTVGFFGRWSPAALVTPESIGLLRLFVVFGLVLGVGVEAVSRRSAATAQWKTVRNRLSSNPEP